MVKLGELLEEFDQRLGERQEPEILTLTEKMGFISQRERFSKRLAIADTSNYKLIGLNDIAFNPYLLWAGAVAQNTGWEAAIISPLYPTFRVRKGYSARFVNYLLCSGFLRSRYGAISFGSVPRKRRAAVKDFLDLRIPQQPSLTTQERMVNLLDRADELRKLRDQADHRTTALIPALFHEMFGNPQKASRRWPTPAFRELLAEPLRNGLSPAKDGEHSAKVLTLSAITGEAYDEAAWKSAPFKNVPGQDCRISKSLFLICRGNGSRELVGRAKFPHADFADTVFPDTVIAAVPKADRLVPEFLEEAWESSAARQQIESGARTTNGTYKINQTMVENLRLPLPPLPLQKEFAARVSEIHAMQNEQAGRRRRLDDLFQSLLHRAFKGEL